jgi:hypothetical protein
MQYVAYTYRGRTNGHRNKVVSHVHPTRELAAAELLAMLSPRQLGVETAIALPGGNIGGDIRPIYRHQLPPRPALSAADIEARQADYPRAR